MTNIEFFNMSQVDLFTWNCILLGQQTEEESLEGEN